VDRFRADVAVLLNVTEDHLDRYDTFADYAAAKARVFAGQRAGDAAVVPARDELVLSLARAAAAEIHAFGDPDGEVRATDGAIRDSVSGLAFPLDALRIRGAHNVDNACAAALAARLAGVGPDQIAAVLSGFTGLPHRMQHVRARAGVDFYDDSKATNVGAAVAAVDGLGDFGGRIVLIAGGVDKEGSWAPLRARMERVGRAVVVIGEATPIVERAFEGSALSLPRATDMSDAVQKAADIAEPGDVVLLAPACASFDMFRSYAHRGDVFQEAVRALPEVVR
jgi:UDP-N-acetylmuramoylalanine--D-glutamate ligase